MAGMVPQQTQSAQVPQSAQPILDSKAMNAAQQAFVQAIGTAFNGPPPQAPTSATRSTQALAPAQPAPQGRPINPALVQALSTAFKGNK